MLTVDLVNARRRAGTLKLVGLDDAARGMACELAARVLEVANAHIGATREELDAAMDAIEVGPREHRLKAGLAKLVEDRCQFDGADDEDPESLRREVFTRASATRAALAEGQHFDRNAVLDAVAQERGTSREHLEGALFSDLRGAHRLLALEAISPRALMTAYEHGQAQAVLLRAVKVEVDVQCATAGALRAFFRRLKFLRLLYSIEKLEEARGYRIVIDGPFSLFESVTKYGLQLALLLPVLEDCDAWKLRADIRWGKERTPLKFELESTPREAAGAQEEPPLPDDVAALVRNFEALETDWRVSPAAAVLELPGVGLCVPDLVFERGRGRARKKVHLEVMGYWSRDAVWRRVELVQAGLGERILFAVSSRLRVSEAVLEGDLPGALYVYKGTMNARAVAERLERLA